MISRRRFLATSAAAALDFTAEEKRRILRHGPWPPASRPDPSNRVSGRPAAIAFGRALFFDPRLSVSGAVSCATCHPPDRAWTDGLARSRGHRTVDRNAPSLFNLRFNRWFGWDGAQDSLWAQNLRPLLDRREMGVVRLRHSNFGEFRVPGLRNVSLTAPYMHAGSLATLADVARHYSTIDEERLHAGGERILRRLDLSVRERADLVAFSKR